MEKRSILLVCHAGSFAGLGHLSRLLALAQALRQIDKFRIEFLIFGDNFEKDELALFKVHRRKISSDFEKSLKKLIEQQAPSMVVLDLYPKLLPLNIEDLLLWIKGKDIGLIGIDSLINYYALLDLIWMPTFKSSSQNNSDFTEKVISGWDTLLIQKRLPTPEWCAGNNVLILTGGSDTTFTTTNVPVNLHQL